jgi:hypothetical protein
MVSMPNIACYDDMQYWACLPFARRQCHRHTLRGRASIHASEIDNHSVGLALRWPTA